MQARTEWNKVFKMLTEKAINLEFYIQYKYLSKVKEQQRLSQSETERNLPSEKRFMQKKNYIGQKQSYIKKIASNK